VSKKNFRHHICIFRSELFISVQVVFSCIGFYFLLHPDNIVMSMSVFCLSVRISRKPHGQTSPFYAHVAYSHTVARSSCGETLCTSGFVDDVTFSDNGHYNASCVFLSGDSVTVETTVLISIKFYSVIKISNYISWVAHLG